MSGDSKKTCDAKPQPRSRESVELEEIERERQENADRQATMNLAWRRQMKQLNSQTQTQSKPETPLREMPAPSVNDVLTLNAGQTVTPQSVSESKSPSVSKTPRSREAAVEENIEREKRENADRQSVMALQWNQAIRAQMGLV